MSVLTLRRTQLEDMAAVERAHSTSIREICAKDYKPEQIERWSAVSYDPKVWEKNVLEGFHVVVLKEGRIEGFCHAEHKSGHQGAIVGLYFTRAAAGHGFGRKALSMALDHLREQGCAHIVLTSTVTAKGFYERMGFRCVSKREAQIRGTVVDCFDMALDV